MFVKRIKTNPIILRFTLMQSLKRGLCVLFVLLVSFELLVAQSTLQVVSKTIEERIAWSSGQEVNIKGERAEVSVEAWERPEVMVVFEFIAKHPDKKVATGEVALMRHVAEKQGNRIFLRNYISENEDGSKPASSLKAKIKIKLPEDCPVNLSNHVGEASIKDLDNELQVSSEFCKITLYDLAGKIGINTRFGDVEGERLDGYVNINARRSNIHLSDLKGFYDIQAKYGVIKIYADQSLSKLNIDAEKSHVFLFTPKQSLFEYALTSQYGNIFVPDNMDFNFTEQSQNLQKAVLQSRKELGAVSVTISVAFGDIDIKNRK